MPLLVSLTKGRVIYSTVELDRSWTEIVGVNPSDGTIRMVAGLATEPPLARIVAANRNRPNLSFRFANMDVVRLFGFPCPCGRHIISSLLVFQPVASVGGCHFSEALTRH